MGVTLNALAGLGFDREAPMVVLPIDTFLVGSDLEPLRSRITEIEQRLTDWRPACNEVGTRAAPAVDIPANAAETFFDRFNRESIASTWSDGLPLVPPTRERVDWILRGDDDPPDTSVGKIMPRGGIATLDTLAVSLAMAGGRPEYLPVLRAAIEAILDPGLDHDKFQATSGSTFPVVIVNGPVGERIRLGSGFGCLGPDPQNPAGATIGRAIRLLLQNVGGALPGVGTMAIFGAMRFTNVVFAEDEAGLPEGWLPVSVEHGATRKGENAVTVYVATGATNVMRRGVGKEDAMTEAVQGLRRAAGYIGVPNGHYAHSYAKGPPGALLIPRVVARQLVAAGWKSKAAVREFLWEHSKIARTALDEYGVTQWIEAEPDAVTRASLELDPWPICARPEQLIVAVAGGEHPTHNFWLQAWGPRLATRRIGLPEEWEGLLAEADDALGAGGEHCTIG